MVARDVAHHADGRGMTVMDANASTGISIPRREVHAPPAVVGVAPE
jgi:hypothetical protein